MRLYMIFQVSNGGEYVDGYLVGCNYVYHPDDGGSTLLRDVGL